MSTYEKPRDSLPTGLGSNLSLRDYFAAKALWAAISNTVGSSKDKAANAYAIADAMLAARKGRA